MNVEMAALVVASGTTLATALVGMWDRHLRLRFLRDVFWARLDRGDLEAAGAVLSSGRRRTAVTIQQAPAN